MVRDANIFLKGEKDGEAYEIIFCVVPSTSTTVQQYIAKMKSVMCDVLMPRKMYRQAWSEISISDASRPLS